MVLLIIAVVSIFGTILGRFLFKKWVNHLTFYCIVWGVLIFLYELKLLPYHDLNSLSWFFIISAFLSFLFGILTIISAKNLNIKDPNLAKKSNVSFDIFIDDGRTLRYVIFIFSVICLYAAIQHWMVLIKMFGSITGVFVNARRVYHLSTHGGVPGVVPYISVLGFVAIFFSGIYTAYKRRFSLLTFFPFIGIILKDLATVGRAAMLLAFMEFLFSFFLFKYILNDDVSKRFKFSKKNLIIAFSILIIFFIVSASFVRITRGSTENYSGISRELKQMEGNMIISPSLYLYLSSTIGVLSQYLKSEGEKTSFGENTFIVLYNVLAKLGVQEKPSEFQKGYFIPMWTNTGTYIRELHADFGIAGVFLGPYLIGLLITWLWFKFYEEKGLIVFALLVYFNLIIGFSFLVMVTRLFYWFISLLLIILVLPVLEKIAIVTYRKTSERISERT